MNNLRVFRVVEYWYWYSKVYYSLVFCTISVPIRLVKCQGELASNVGLTLVLLQIVLQGSGRIRS